MTLTPHLRRIARFLPAILAIALAHGAHGGVTAEQARASLEKAVTYLQSISTNGGYLWKYSPDLAQRWGENSATATQIWIQPPGTPAVGQAFLRAYAVTRDERYFNAAQQAATALARSQLASGGWDYLFDFDPAKSTAWYRRLDVGTLTPSQISSRKNTSTFDDNNTQSALLFLLAFTQAAEGRSGADIADIRTALDYGLQKMIEAQYPNGAWPQRYTGTPPNPASYPILAATIPSTYPRQYSGQNYSFYYTLNDNTQSDCIRTLLSAYGYLRRTALLDAAKKGGDFLLLAQLPEPQPVWAQQYNPNMQPAWARAFEPPAAVSAESVGVMNALMELYLATGELKYMEPLSRAIAWFNRSSIGSNLWARFYELGTNTPIYGDRDGQIHYTLEEISEERQTGYSWQGAFNVSSAINLHQSITSQGRAAYLASRQTTSASLASKLSSLQSKANSLINSQDSQGRWLTSGFIETRTFNANILALCDYLEALAPPPGGRVAYADWAKTISNSALRLPDAMPAGDGVPNLLKFALGANNPSDYVNADLPHAAILPADGEISATTAAAAAFTFVRDPQRSGLTYRVRRHHSLMEPLSDWEIIAVAGNGRPSVVLDAAHCTLSENVLDARRTRVVVSDDLPLGGGNWFYVLEVFLP